MFVFSQTSRLVVAFPGTIGYFQNLAGMIYFKCIVVVWLVLAALGSFAQYNIDSVSLKGDFRAWYDQQVGLENTVLQHGELATIGRKSPNSHAYYESSTWLSANVVYCNQMFRDISVLYNIEDDVLFISNNLAPTFTASPLKLRKELVSQFEIGHARFV